MQSLQNPQKLSRKVNFMSSDQLILTNKNSRQSITNLSPIVVTSNMKSSEHQRSHVKASRVTSPKQQQSSFCTKHNKCQSNHYQNLDNDQTQFSIDSQYLQQQTPLQLQIQPEIQIQVKPNIDILISTNLKMNKYKQTYQKIQKEQELKSRNQQLKKLNQSAKQALLRTKSQKQQHNNKWGHSVYQNQLKISPQQQKKAETIHKPLIHSPTDKKQHLQNAAQKAKQRIIQFKQKQLEKQKQQQKNQKLENAKKLDQKKLSEVNTKIAQNAAEILKQKQAQIQQAKKKQQQIKRKIEQLQKQSLNNCKKSRQNPLKFQQGKQQQFHLQQSQYSTFQARQQGRKMIKKQKKKKTAQPKQVKQQDSKVVAKSGSHRYLKQKMAKTTPNFNKTKKSQNTQKGKQNINNQSQQQQKQNEQQQKSKQQFKKFYVWNVPVKQEDFSLVALSQQLQEQKILQKQVKKQQPKSFKEEAEEYLRQKQLHKLQAAREKSRAQLLKQKIAEKKQQFLKEYEDVYEHRKIIS